MTPFDLIPVPVWQATVAGAFVAAGWLVNGWQNRRVAASLRDERLRDVHRALYAEIGTNVANLGSVAGLEAERQTIDGRMHADPGFVPFIPRERDDRVFEALVKDIHILPRSSIDAVVAYYVQIGRIAALAEDMRSDGFRSLEQDRRILMYGDYIAMKKQSLLYGEHAKVMINAYANGGPAAARRARSDAAQ